MTKKTKPKIPEAPTQPHHHTQEVVGFLILTGCLILLLSLLSFAYGTPQSNWIGLIGTQIGLAFHTLFGITSYLITAFIASIGFRMLLSKPIEHLKIRTLYFSIFTVSLCVLLSLFEDAFPSFQRTMHQLFYPNPSPLSVPMRLGGVPLFFLYRDLPFFSLKRILNALGVGIIFTATLLASILFFSKVSLGAAIAFLKNLVPKKATEVPVETTNNRDEARVQDRDFFRLVNLREPKEKKIEVKPEPPKPQPSNSAKREAALDEQRLINGDLTKFKIPSGSLLSNPNQSDQSSLKKDLREKAEILEETLASFGIQAKVGQINYGPTITSFEVHPAVGVKVQRIRTLENDIALNLQAKSIRIIAPIPGKAAVGIEVPNPHPEEVGFKDLLSAYQKQGSNFEIPLLLGKTVSGEVLMQDLSKMPHLIIAGATGSGKSVCINTIIMSILLNAKPDEIKLLMVDPKKVELTPYSNLPHMIAPVITEPHGAFTALQWLVKEMENRYELLKHMGVRNIIGFNKRTIDKAKEESLNIEIPEHLPYIVMIIDELADLMMVSGGDIETPIARIAQMARAVGIHMILATQRPSREVITGIIKANFPTRISFKVSSRVNSQIILDEPGSEQLLGNGDMLILPPGTSNLLRAQGAYVRDEDIQAVVDSICKQCPPNYLIPSFDNPTAHDCKALGDLANADRDDLYSQALEIVTKTGNASTTFLQRKLKVGYARAASLMDQLEEGGVVTPPDGSRARKVLVGAPCEDA